MENSAFDMRYGNGRGIDFRKGLFAEIFAYGMLLLCVVALVLFVIQFISKGNKRNMAVAIVPPIIQFVLLGGFTLLMGNYFNEFDGFRYNNWGGNYYKDILEPGLFFYFFLIALVVLIVISVIGYVLAKKRGIIDNAPLKPVQDTTPSSADELKKYHELAESGAITQEEYEAKKKQLLGL